MTRETNLFVRGLKIGTVYRREDGRWYGLFETRFLQVVNLPIFNRQTGTFDTQEAVERVLLMMAKDVHKRYAEYIHQEIEQLDKETSKREVLE